MTRNDNDEPLVVSDEDDVAGSMRRGISALLVVALSVGLLVGLGVMVVTKAIGLGDNPQASSGSSVSATLYMPEPKATATVGGKPTVEESQSPTKEPAELELTAAPTTVSSMGKITLSGRYPEGAGAVLQVERKVGTSWEVFGGGVSVTVQGDGTFSTWIQTGQAGPNVFRVSDQDKSLSSDPVTVTVG